MRRHEPAALRRAVPARPRHQARPHPRRAVGRVHGGRLRARVGPRGGVRRAERRRRNLHPPRCRRGERVVDPGAVLHLRYLGRRARAVRAHRARPGGALPPAHQVERSARCRRGRSANAAARVLRARYRAAGGGAHRPAVRRAAAAGRRRRPLGRCVAGRVSGAALGRRRGGDCRSGTAARCGRAAALHRRRRRGDLGRRTRARRLRGSAGCSGRDDDQRQGCDRRGPSARRRRRRLERRDGADARRRRGGGSRRVRGLPRWLGYDRALALPGARQGRRNPSRRRPARDRRELSDRGGADRRREAHAGGAARRARAAGRRLGTRCRGEGEGGKARRVRAARALRRAADPAGARRSDPERGAAGRRDRRRRSRDAVPVSLGVLPRPGVPVGITSRTAPTVRSAIRWLPPSGRTSGGRA